MGSDLSRSAEGWQRQSISTDRPPSSSFFPDGDGQQLAFLSWLFHEEVLRTELTTIHQEPWFTSCLSEHSVGLYWSGRKKGENQSEVAHIANLSSWPGSQVRLENLLCITKDFSIDFWRSRLKGIINLKKRKQQNSSLIRTIAKFILNIKVRLQ